MRACDRCQKSRTERKYDRLRYAGRGLYLCDTCLRAFDAWVSAGPARNEESHPEFQEQSPEHPSSSRPSRPERGGKEEFSAGQRVSEALQRVPSVVAAVLRWSFRAGDRGPSNGAAQKKDEEGLRK